MEKNKFKAPVMEIILFDAADIITDSGKTSEGDGKLDDNTGDENGNGTGNDTY